MMPEVFAWASRFSKPAVAGDARSAHTVAASVRRDSVGFTQTGSVKKTCDAARIDASEVSRLLVISELVR